MEKLGEKTVEEILAFNGMIVDSPPRLVNSNHDSLNGSQVLTSTARGVKIPRQIMQTWKTKIIPAHWIASQRSIRTLMPSWNYTLLTDEDNLKFVEAHFPDFVFYFKSFEYPIQRADAIRYMWLYVNGGLYIDLDLEIIKPLDALFLDDRDLYVVKSSIMPNIYTNAFMAAKARLPVMLRCLDEMKAPYAYWHVGKHLKVVNSTGPNMFTKAIQDEVGSFTASEPSNGLKVIELPGDLIIACSICDPKPCCTEDGYCRLLGGSSWSEGDTELLTKIFCHRRELVVMFVIMVIVIAVVIVLYKKRAFRRNRY